VAIDPAEPAHGLSKGHSALLACGIIGAPTDPDHYMADAAVLLRPRRERPGNCCAAEQRDELAPLCMTGKKHSES
jgi:hypothetical protein